MEREREKERKRGHNVQHADIYPEDDGVLQNNEW